MINRFRLIHWTLALSLGLLFSSCTVYSQKKNADKTVENLDKIFQQSLTDFNVPGMAIAIVKDNKVVLSKGYGVKNSETGEKVDENSLFAIASNSKAFTAACLAILVDEGKIKWNDKVRTYLPYFQLYDPYVTEEMTIRDLLCHRSGLATFSGDLIWYGTTYSREEVIRRAVGLEPKHGFRETFGYQNIMFIAAGEIVEVVSGLSWDDFVQQRILNPLGMSSTVTSITKFKPGGNIAMPHNEKDGKNILIDYVNWDNIGGAGAINSNVSDVSKWLMLQLNKGKWNDQTIFSEARAFEMWENQTPLPIRPWQRQNMPSRHFSGYGLGWELMEYQGYKVISHGGGYDGMISKTVLVPELNLGFVILTNNINSLPTILNFEILDEYLGVKKEDQTDWITMFKVFKTEDDAMAAGAAQAREDARTKNTQPSKANIDYCGTYRSEIYGDVLITLDEKGNPLIDFTPTALFKGRLEHYHYDTFILNWSTKMMLPPGTVTFVLDAAGEIEEMKVFVDNPDFDFTELKLMKVK
jgi:CubicO group peptidase (beta-lactamase class C family)